MLLRLGLIALLSLLVNPGTPPVAETPPSKLDLTPWQGRVVLVDFWASWCAPCIDSFPWMGKMIEKYGDRGLTIVAVNLDEDAEAAQAFLASAPPGFEHVRDPEGEIPEAFGISVMPSSVLFDRDGTPAYLHEGFHSAAAGDYEERIVSLLEGRGDPERKEVLLSARKHGRLGVRPWQRDLLADDAMRLDCDPLDLAIDDHIYFSKEASSGGRGFGGGGCGCN